MSDLRDCPVCGTPHQAASLFLAENIDLRRMSSFSYASRKEPEYMCHRLLACPNCELIYAVSPPAKNKLANLYHMADYDSAAEAKDAAMSYITAILPILLRFKNHPTRALEIGAGTGVFLELLREHGFIQTIGIEPSSAAIAAAPPHRRMWLQEGIFEEHNFAAESFDLICCFMTMEHVLDPKAVTLAAYRLLRPGGAFVTITHDYRSLVNRLLGKRSPIIDIEHMQLFSKASICQLFARCGFSDISTDALVNRYAMSYWLRLMPLPKPIKQMLNSLANFTGLAEYKIAFNVGNTIAAGFRPN